MAALCLATLLTMPGSSRSKRRWRWWWGNRGERGACLTWGRLSTVSGWEMAESSCIGKVYFIWIAGLWQELPLVAIPNAIFCEDGDPEAALASG